MVSGARSAFHPLTVTKKARRWRETALAFVVAAGAIGFSGFVPAFAADQPARPAEFDNPRLERHASVPASTGASLPAAQLTPQGALSACNSSWNIAVSPSPVGRSEFGAVAAISASDIWTVGLQTTGAGVKQTLSEHWNGTSWASVPTPNTGSTGDNVLNSVAAIATGDVWAVGVSRPNNNSPRSTLIERWNGSSWSIIASPNVNPGIASNALFAVKGDASNDVWAVGTTFSSTTSPTVLVEHWDGVSWTISPGTQNPSSLSVLVALTVLSPTNVWAVGLQSADGVTFKTLIEHFDGTTWTVSASTNAGNGSGHLNGISGSANDLWAVGFAATSTTTIHATLVEHWNGSSWSTVAAPTGSDTDLDAVAALSPSNAWAVGTDFGTSTTPDRTYVLHWDGSTWSTVVSPNVAGASNALFDIAAVSASDVWAVGTAPVTTSSWQTLSENYCVPPAITSITPTGGSPSGSTPVTITGSGLVWASGVNFGTSPAPSFTVTSDSQITAVSPSGAGTVDVRVAYFAGLSAATPSDQFTYIVTAPLAPNSVVAIAGVGSATVYWSAPASDGGALITSYTATAYDVNQIAQGSATVTGSPPATSAVVSGLTNGSTYTFKVTATNSVGAGPASAASNQVTPGLGPFHSLVPGRILDTRVGPVPASWIVGTPLGPQGTITVQITGQGGVPSTGVSAVILNVTVTNTTAPSFLTIYPAGVPRPLASSLNWVAGASVPNLVEVAVGAGGQVAAYNGAGSTDVIFDVAGYVSTPAAAPGTDGLYNPVLPARILDTRNGNGGFSAPVGPGQTINVQVGGRTGSGIPASGVSAVVLNVTATGATAPSYLTVYPMGASRPLASNLNFVAGQTVPNRVIVKVGINPQTTTSGWVSIYNGVGSVNVIADVGGWFTDGTDPAATGAAFVGMTPTRLIDTRNGRGPIGAAGTLILPIAGLNGVPSTAKAVVLNVTVTGPTAPSFLTVWPDGATQPLASDLNYVVGLTVPNLVVVKVGTNGAVDFYNGVGSVDVIVDIVGWYG